MNNQLETNLQYVDLLNEWDPFQIQDGNYDIEIADVIQSRSMNLMNLPG